MALSLFEFVSKGKLLLLDFLTLSNLHTYINIYDCTYVYASKVPLTEMAAKYETTILIQGIASNFYTLYYIHIYIFIYVVYENILSFLCHCIFSLMLQRSLEEKLIQSRQIIQINKMYDYFLFHFRFCEELWPRAEKLKLKFRNKI